MNKISILSNYYRTFYENAPDMMMLIDLENYKVLDCNLTLTKHTGYTKQEIYKLKNLSKLFNFESARDLIFLKRKYFSSLSLSNELVQLKSKSGRLIAVAIGVSTPLKSTAGTLIARVIMREAQEIKERMALQKAREQEILRKNEDLMTLVYTLSHDLKAPLRGIGNLAELVRQDLKLQLSPCYEDYLTYLEQKSSKLHILIDDIVNYYALTTKPLEITMFNIKELLEEVLERLVIPEGFKIKRNIYVKEVVGYSHVFYESLVHLLDNAIRYHPSPSKGLAEVEVTQDEQNYIIQVSDNGNGMSDSQLDEAREPYFMKPIGYENRRGLGIPLIIRLLSEAEGQVVFSKNEPHGLQIQLIWPKKI